MRVRRRHRHVARRAHVGVGLVPDDDARGRHARGLQTVADGLHDGPVAGEQRPAHGGDLDADDVLRRDAQPRPGRAEILRAGQREHGAVDHLARAVAVDGKALDDVGIFAPDHRRKRARRRRGGRGRRRRWRRGIREPGRRGFIVILAHRAGPHNHAQCPEHEEKATTHQPEPRRKLSNRREPPLRRITSPKPGLLRSRNRPRKGVKTSRKPGKFAPTSSRAKSRDDGLL